jgi:glycosyltransferase involved in cell wall biosynthesis
MAEVSVVIPTYNRATVLPRAIRSVLTQEGPACEVVVVDDGSTDDTQSVVERFEAVRYIRLGENRGVSGARNRGLDATDGDAVLLLDSDDALVEGALATLTTHLEADDDACAGVTSGYRRLTGGLVTDVVRFDERTVSLTDLEAGAVQGGWGASGTLYRRDLFETIGGFDEALGKGEDFDLFVRALAAGYRFRYVPDVLLSVYDREDNITSSALRSIVDSNRRLLEKHGERLPPSYLAERAFEMGYARLGMGAVSEAERDFARALARRNSEPGRARLHYRIAIAYAEQNHRSPSIRHFTESLQAGSRTAKTSVHLLAMRVHPRCWHGVSRLYEGLTARLTHLRHGLFGTP